MKTADESVTDLPLSRVVSATTVGSYGGNIYQSESRDPLVASVDSLPSAVTNPASCEQQVSPKPTFVHLPNGSSSNTASDVDNDNHDKCGWGSLRPAVLQRFRTPRWVLFSLCWAGALQGLIVNGFINVVITTIEKRYNLKSTESGLIAGSYDIASFLCLIPISYMGGSRSKPLFIGSGLTILSLGSFVFSLPYFLAGRYTFSQEHEQTCPLNNTIHCQSGDSSLSNYKYLFLFGQLLHGAGATPLYTLGCTYLDEIVSTKMSSVYIGIFYTMAIVGPAMGYVLGGQLLRIYVDIGVNAKELGLSPSSSVWVGAWWIGFLFAAVIGLIISVPITAFPKTLPGTSKIKRITEMHQKLQDSEAARIGFGKSLKDLPSSFKLLITNPTFIFLSLAGASEGMLVAGLATFLPKLIESQFSLAASYAAFLVGLVTIPGAGGGNFLGGYLVKKFNMKCAQIIRLCIISCAICLAFALVFLVHCPNPTFAGVTNATDRNFKFDDGCNINCNCSINQFDPVCGTDNIIYYSPCFAGCQIIHQTGDSKLYDSCLCVNNEGINYTVGESTVHIMATREKCTNNCSYGPLFLSVIFFCMVFTFLVSMPSLVATLRCVAETQKSFALGIQWIAVRLLGTIPGPIIFGSLIDLSCDLWQDSCSMQGSCLFYDNKRMSTNMLIIACTVKTFSCIFFFIAWLLYKPPSSGENPKSNITGRSFSEQDSIHSFSNRGAVLLHYSAQESSCDVQKSVLQNNNGLEAERNSVFTISNGNIS